MNANDFEKQSIDYVNAKRFRDLVVPLDDPNSAQNRAMRRLRHEKKKRRAAERNIIAMLGDNFPIEHVGTLTAEQDMEFSKAYGNNYYKDPEFFTKRFPQLSADPDTTTD